MTFDEISPPGQSIIMGSNGCDSVVTVDLTFNPTGSGSFDSTLCSGSGYSITVGSMTFDEITPSGQSTIIGSNGCDSVVMVDLTFNPTGSGSFDSTLCSGSG